MIVKVFFLLVSLTAVLNVAAGDAVPDKFGGAAPLAWSKRLASSEMTRRGKSLSKDGAPKARWDYTTGLFAHSLLELGGRTDDGEIIRYATDLVGSFITEDGTIATYQQSDYNIDMVTPGRVVLAAYERSKENRYKLAAEQLRRQLAKQPRTSDGGFWHKQRYPWQMWLDGLYMGSPFLARYGKVFQEPAAFDEVILQIILMDRHAYDPKTGLYFHGWDEKHQQSWANPQTGTSPCFWGRSIGWYAMAIVDCLDYLPPAHQGTDSVNEILRRLADGVVRYQDPASGLWWQVVDQQGREGNYLETTASSMFVYALAKGINRGYLDRARFLPAVIKGYQGLVRDCTRTDDSGALHLMHNCEVAGLGMTSAAGRPRNGTFEYYISEPVVDNDLKGVGPFILAGIEMSKLAATQQPSAARSAYDAVVSATGDGDYTTVQESINKVPQTTTAHQPWIILIKPGTYQELIHAQREKRFVHLVGEDPQKTVITYGLFASMKGPDGKEIGTFRTPTATIDADDFVMENLTLENSAGPVGQALAIRVDGDRVAFRNCVFNGYQDTILLNRGRQYFANCTINGAVDFIFGAATSFFDRCTLNCVRDGYITAASTPVEAPYGFVFANCTITAGLGVKVYLGRPWRAHASTIFINTHLPDGIRPEGWHNWRKPDNEKTARYFESGSTGPGANPARRVGWAKQLPEDEARTLTAARILGGPDAWHPAAPSAPPPAR